MKSTLLSATILALSIMALPDVLTGKWQTKPSVNGNVTGIHFKPDNTYEAYINRKPFVSGRYSLKDSFITITENGCDDKSGIYKIILFNNGDSLKFQPVLDSCKERREGMSRTILGRVKPNPK